MRYYQFSQKKTITEGGNIFKAPDWSRENPQMLTSRISRDEVPHTLDYLETITGIELADNLLGSTGIAPTSGDIDIAVDARKHPKDRLEGDLLEAGVDPDHLVKTGESLHYMCPILDENGETGRFVQVDFMFVPDVQFARWSMRTAPDSEYKGVYLQKLRADLTNTVAPKDPSGKSQWKWNHFKGVLKRSDDSSVFGFDPDKIAKGLLGPRASKDDLESVERILRALKDSGIRKDVVNTYRQTLARDQGGKQLPPDEELDK